MNVGSRTCCRVLQFNYKQQPVSIVIRCYLLLTYLPLYILCHYRNWVTANVILRLLKYLSVTLRDATVGNIISYSLKGKWEATKRLDKSERASKLVAESGVQVATTSYWTNNCTNLYWTRLCKRFAVLQVKKLRNSKNMSSFANIGENLYLWFTKEMEKWIAECKLHMQKNLNNWSIF